MRSSAQKRESRGGGLKAAMRRLPCRGKHSTAGRYVASWAGAFLAAATLAAVSSPPAAAEGGSSIAGAPVVAYGVHETGDTSNGGQGEFHWYCEDVGSLNRNSFWQLPVTVGDHVTIDWGAVILGSTCLTVYPIGTNDYGVPTAEPEESTQQGSNGKQEMNFTAPATGSLILDFAAKGLYSGCTTCAGPYEFTAYVKHALQIALATPTPLYSNSTVTATVTQNTGAPIPNGLALTLRAQDEGAGLYEATATTTNGVASFPLALPASAIGDEVTIVVVRSEDSQYAEGVSNTVSATVEAPPSPPTTTVQAPPPPPTRAKSVAKGHAHHRSKHRKRGHHRQHHRRHRRRRHHRRHKRHRHERRRPLNHCELQGEYEQRGGRICA